MNLDVERLLNRAEKNFLLNTAPGDESSAEFRFRIRIANGTEREALEQQLRKVPAFRISRYRDVREGLTRVGWPSEISLSISDLLRIRPELAEVKAKWKEAKTYLDSWMDWTSFITRNFAECRKKASLLPALALVLRYMIENRSAVAGLYPRQIPHGQSTKLIGYEPLLLRLYDSWRGNSKPSDWPAFFREFGLVRRTPSFEFYADEINWDGTIVQKLHALLNEDNAARWGLSEFKRILIVENEETFYPLRGILENSLLILGAGKKAAALGFLAAHLSPSADVFYWGDIDKEGYEILFGVAERLKRVRPVLMDGATIDRHWSIRQSVERAEPGASGTLLQVEYQRVCNEGFLIEQEQIEVTELLRALDCGSAR